MWNQRRLARNRRDKVLIAVFAVVVLAPVLLGIGYLFSSYVVRLTMRQTSRLRSQVSFTAAAVQVARNRGESTAWLERDLDLERDALARSREADRTVILPLMLLVATGLAGCLGMLLWSTAGSATSRLLTRLGALPADGPDGAAAQLLGDLAARAGMPVPKLYVVNTAVPVMFADGSSPQHASIAVTRGALDLLDQRELAGLLAHQLSHICNGDVGVNALLASIGLLLKMPYRLLRGRLFRDGKLSKTRLLFIVLQLVLSPISLYVFIVAPILGWLIRAVTSHDREFVADADAASLTADPQALLSALAKIAGATAAAANTNLAFAHSCLADPRAYGNWLSGSLTANHPPLTKRIDRLAAIHGVSSVSGLQQSVDKGREYAAQHQSMGEDAVMGADPRDEFHALNQGHVMGRVYRLMSDEPVPVYDSDGPRATPLLWVKPGELIVAFDDPSRMRQVNTAAEVFGYIDRKVKLKPVAGVLPQEVYHPKMRVAAEEALAKREAVAAVAGRRAKRDTFPIALGLVAAGLICVTVLVFVLVR